MEDIRVFTFKVDRQDDAFLEQIERSAFAGFYMKRANGDLCRRWGKGHFSTTNYTVALLILLLAAPQWGHGNRHRIYVCFHAPTSEYTSSILEEAASNCSVMVNSG